MITIPYDATRNSLFHPGAADDFFSFGPLQTDLALCAEMSRLAYVKETARLDKYLGRMQFTAMKTLGYARGGEQAFIARNAQGDATVVAFRGTEPDDPSDIFADADFRMTGWRDHAGQPCGSVHEGFAACAHNDDLFAQVKAHLDTLAPAVRVLLTGHSLGAALATLMASWAPSAHLYAIGSPRVGDAVFAQSLKNPVAVRVVNCCDIVTRIPPALGFRYVHAGALTYIDGNGHLLQSPGESAIATDCAEASARYFVQHAFLHGTVFSRDLADHAPINYVSGVMGLRAQA